MKRRLINLPLFAALLLSLSGGETPAHAILRGNGVCARLYRTLTGRPAPQIETATRSEAAPTAAAAYSTRKINSLDELLQAFSQGLVPDLTNPSQRDAFEIYRRMRFGNPDTHLNAGTLDEIALALKKHPELEKEVFRDFRLDVQERTYPVTKDLTTYLDPQVANAGQTRANLFQVEANSGYWKKVLQFDDSEGNKAAPLARDATPEQKAAFREHSKQSAEKDKARWIAFLDGKLPPAIRASLMDLAQPPKERATVLFHFLQIERNRLISEGKDTRPVSQAMVDLIHTIGYHDPEVLKAFKSSNGMDRLNAYRKILDERDQFAMQLGFPDHFNQVLLEIGRPAGVTVPNGVPSASIATEVEQLENALLAGSKVVNSSGSTRTIRHLSLVESPFRSCLGGSDCSSRTYLTRALDPNYHYFTLTNESGMSSGQITVVLGDGKLHGTPVKMAFVDKIQNVPNTDLPQMIEGVRRSLDEKGYKVTVPDNIGDHNGLSNEVITRSFVEKTIQTDPKQPIVGFTPHRHSYEFPNAYSRAEKSLPCHVITPLKLPEGVEITPGNLTVPWKTGNLDLKQLVQASVQLKHSPNLEDQLRYIPSMKAIELAGLKVDPEFNGTLAHWLEDRRAPFQLRKQALLYQWTERSKPLLQLLMSFSRNDQAQLLQNLLDTPRYRDLLLKDKNSILDLLITGRANKKVRETLIDAYAEDRAAAIRQLLGRVLETSNLPDAAALEIVKQIKASLGSGGGIDVLKIPMLATGTSAEGWLKTEIFNFYATTLQSEPDFGRALAKCLNSQDFVLQDFGRQLLEKDFHPAHAGLQTAKAFREVVAFQHSHPEFREFQQAASAWMKSERVAPELKSSFLLSHSGSKNGLYETYRSALPHEQLPLVTKLIGETTNIEVFERLIAKHVRGSINSTLHPLFENGKLESFVYHPHPIPEGGKKVILGSPSTEPGRFRDEMQHEVTLAEAFEMQATPVTQLQWSIVMGDNPSEFKIGGQEIKINGHDVLMHPNRPVESVSWDDAQKYIRKLNQNDPHYNYRLPTEAEWEYAARAGTDTPYSFGSNPADLGAYGWHAENSGKQTHDVASLKPNPNGLYDMHGNVGEWVQDHYMERPPQSMDNIGPSRHIFRVYRGGSWLSDASYLRSARRKYSRPDFPSAFIGIRLVRTPK